MRETAWCYKQHGYRSDRQENTSASDLFAKSILLFAHEFKFNYEPNPSRYV
jgi:hypothetical protein